MEDAIDEFHRFGPRIGAGWDWSRAPAARGKPFRAEFEEVHTRKPTNEVARCRGSVAQDSAGRLREDIFLPDASEVSGTRHITVIVDAVTLTYYFIDQETKDVRKIELGPVVQRQLAGKPQSGTSPRECPLPTSPRQVGIEAVPAERLIEGVSCRGTVLHEPSGTTIESWSSDRLGHAFPVLEVTRGKDLDTLYRLFNLELQEPDPALFVVPGPAR
jgi:hypothetical protein